MTPKSRRSERIDAFAKKLRDHWTDSGFPGPGRGVAVACSGGVDSLVLLHALRFGCEDLGLRISVAHFDHGMRQHSAEEAAWVRGVAGAWGVPLHAGAAAGRLEGEAAARRARYEFLEALLADGPVDAVLTAHHADDQVETVLFRLARGTGIDGLSGIPAVRKPGILRPLLPFSRDEIEEYALAAGLRPRLDPTNQSLAYARNRVRHRALPELEAAHPGARAGILRVARIADRTAEALSELVRPHLDAITVGQSPTARVLSLEGLLGHTDVVRAEILRAAAVSLGVTLSESATISVLSFVSEGVSGTGIQVAGGLGVDRSFDQLRLRSVTEAERARPGGRVAGDFPERIRIDGPNEGGGRMRIGGALYDVEWAPVPADRPESRQGGSRKRDGIGSGVDPGEQARWHSGVFAAESLTFPLSVRGWEPGDRVRGPTGRRKVKRLFAEARIPREARGSVPLVVGSDGLVIWVASTSFQRPQAGPAEPRWWVGVRMLEDPGLCWGS